MILHKLPTIQYPDLVIWQWVAWIGLTAQLLALGGCKERGAPPRPPGVSAAAPQEQPPPLGYDPRKMLDEKTRASAIRPQRALSLLGLSPGMVVADIGAGPGYFTFRMARAVGPGGRVYALEIRDSVLKLLRRRSADRKLNPHQNVVPVNNREDDTNLRPTSCISA